MVDYKVGGKSYSLVIPAGESVELGGLFSMFRILTLDGAADLRVSIDHAGERRYYVRGSWRSDPRYSLPTSLSLRNAGGSSLTVDIALEIGGFSDDGRVAIDASTSLPVSTSAGVILRAGVQDPLPAVVPLMSTFGSLLAETVEAVATAANAFGLLIYSCGMLSNAGSAANKLRLRMKGAATTDLFLAPNKTDEDGNMGSVSLSMPLEIPAGIGLEWVNPTAVAGKGQLLYKLRASA